MRCPDCRHARYVCRTCGTEVDPPPNTPGTYGPRYRGMMYQPQVEEDYRRTVEAQDLGFSGSVRGSAGSLDAWSRGEAGDPVEFDVRGTFRDDPPAEQTPFVCEDYRRR